MKYIGAHVSASGGICNAILNAEAIGANAFALFTRNQRSWVSKPLATDEINSFRSLLAERGFEPQYVLPHDSYLINLGSPDDEILTKSRNAFLDEMKRAEQLGLTMLNFHPGSHLNKISEEECLDQIAHEINAALSQTKGVTAVIENYDLSTEMGYQFCFDDFESIIGFQFLRAIHLNDSKKNAGSHVDRHETLGNGFLGKEFFSRFMHDPRFDNMPIILATPEPSLWAQEIEWLRSL